MISYLTISFWEIVLDILLALVYVARRLHETLDRACSIVAKKASRATGVPILPSMSPSPELISLLDQDLKEMRDQVWGKDWESKQSR